MSPEQIAGAIDVGSAKLKPLLYALVSVGLLTVDGELFANTAEEINIGEPSTADVDKTIKRIEEKK